MPIALISSMAMAMARCRRSQGLLRRCTSGSAERGTGYTIRLQRLPRDFSFSRLLLGATPPATSTRRFDAEYLAIPIPVANLTIHDEVGVCWA